MSLTKLLSVAVFALTGTFLFGSLSHAQDSGETSGVFTPPTRVENQAGYMPHVGALGGLGSPEGSYNTGIEYGLDFGFQPYIPFSIGAELSSATYDGDFTDFTRTKALLKGSYNLGGSTPIIKDSYVGFGVGPMLENTSGDFGDGVAYMGFMPNAGFDILLEDTMLQTLSLGANLRYLITNSDAPDVLALNGVVKYWF